MDSQATIEIPAQNYMIPIKSQSPFGPGMTLTTGTLVAGFEEAKHMLSGKPLRRPNRRKPLGS